MKKVYYAHPKSLYNTLQEKRDVRLLENMGFEVVNPNSDLCIEMAEGFVRMYPNDRERCSLQIIEALKGIAGLCDVVAFRSFIDLKIGRGVWTILEEAKKRNMPIFELPTLTPSRSLTKQETKLYLELLGQ